MSQTLGTIRMPYKVFRAAVSNGAVDSDLTASTKTWANFLTNHRPRDGSSGGTGALAIELKERDNRAVIMFDHTTEGDTAAFAIYGYRKGFPAEFICSIDTLTAGAQQSDITSTTRFLADTIGTVTQRWIGGSSTVTEVDSGGDNGMAKIVFDTYGINYLLILFTTVSAGSVKAFISFY